MTLARALGLLGVAYLALLLTSALPALLPGRVPMPDVALIVALHVGLTCRLTGSAAISARDAGPAAVVGVGLLLGYLQDLIGGTPRGLHALALGLLLLGLRSAATQLLVRGTGFVIAFTALCAILSGLLLSALRAWVDPDVGFGGLAALPGQAAATALCAPPLFAVLRRVDTRLWRDPRFQGLTL